MICGFCATNRHAECNGFCRTTYEFCACADRKHQHPALTPKSQPKPDLRLVVPIGEGE